MKRIDTINVIPFIDIMLVLLAIVLTTATFITHGRLDITLPQAERKGGPSVDSVELAIDRSETLYISDKAVDLDQLRQHLGSLPKETSIVLRVDSAASFARFVAVVDILKTQRLEQLTILTRPRQ